MRLAVRGHRWQIISVLSLVILCLCLSSDATLTELPLELLLDSFRITPGRLPDLAYAPFPTPPRYPKGANLCALKAAWRARRGTFLIPLIYRDVISEALEAAIEDISRLSFTPRRACQLSGLHLGLATLGDNSLHNASHALEYTEAALRETPHSTEARFNQALAFEALLLRDDAAIAWTEYLRLDSESSWADEARQHLRALNGSLDYERRWERARSELEAGVRRPHSLAIVKEFVQPSRLWVERTLLADWAQFYLRGDRGGASQVLNRAMEISIILWEVSGEFLTLESVRTIQQAWNKGDLKGLKALADGHLALEAALRKYEPRTECHEEEGIFKRSQNWLENAGSPMALWASYYRASCSYRHRDYIQTSERLSQLVAKCQSKQYRALCGRTQWLVGLMAFHQNRLAESFSAYSRAQKLVAEERPYLAAVYLYQAEVFLLWGERVRAWQFLGLSLTHLETIPSPERQRKQAILQGVARLAATEGDTTTALRFTDSAYQVAIASPGIIDDALVLRERALILHKTGNDSKAIADLRRAEALLRGADNNQSRSLSAEIQVLRAEFTPAQSNARGWATRIGILEQTRNRIVLPRAFWELGRAQLQAGDSRAAEMTWQRGLQELDHLRPSLQGRLQSDFFKQRDAFLAELLPLQIQLDPSGAAALRTVEYSRGRSSLLHPLAAGVTLEQLQKSLLPSHVLLEYMVLPDRLLIWAIRADRVVFRSVLMPSLRISALISQLRVKNEEDLVFALSSLHKTLIEPVQDVIPLSSTLLIVPDWGLYAVPFAALYDAQKKRYMVEDYLITVLPDAHSLNRKRPKPTQKPSKSILAIGDPAFSADQSPNLRHLRGAAEETKAVWRLYDPGGSRLLLRERATPSALLKGLGHFEVIQYGGHAVASSADPAMSRLLLAPEFSRSGDLSAHELYGRDFSGTRLVVLAACETATAEAWTHHGGLEGFVEPLLGGGVKNVLATLWKVNDSTMMRQVIEFHHEYRRTNLVVQSLANIQRRELRRGESVRSWAALAAFGAVP